MGRLAGFSVEGRPVRVFVKGMPGADEVEVVQGTVVEVLDGNGDGRRSALVHLAQPTSSGGRDVSWLLATPADSGWGLDALWFSFIAVEAEALADRDRRSGEPLGRWFIRLGREPA